MKTQDDKVTINAKGAQLQVARAGQALPLPDEFPKDVYLPAGFAVSNSMKVPRMLNVSGTAEGSATDLFEQARTSMREQGWQEKLVTQRPQMQMLSLEKDGREAVINLMPRDGRVQVSYSLRMPHTD